MGKPENWNEFQSASVTGVDDARIDGNKLVPIVFLKAVSADPKYDGLNPEELNVINLDDEGAMFIVTNPSGNTNENGPISTFSVKLASEPADIVTFGY